MALIYIQVAILAPGMSSFDWCYLFKLSTKDVVVVTSVNCKMNPHPSVCRGVMLYLMNTIVLLNVCHGNCIMHISNTFKSDFIHVSIYEYRWI